MTDAGEAARCDSTDHEAVVIRAFLDQARWLADWHRQAGDRFENKAATILGSSGVLVVLANLVAEPSRDVRGRWSVTLVALLVAATIAFVAAALASVWALRPRKYEIASRQQLKDEWSVYYDTPHRDEVAVVGMVVDQLVRGSSEKSPIDSLAADAKRRGDCVRVAIWALLSGLACMTGSAVILFVEASVR